MTPTINAVRNSWTTSSIEVTNLIPLKPRYDVLLTFLGTEHSNVLYSSGRYKNVFINLPLVAYWRCKNISDILVRAKLPEPSNTDQSRSPLGSFRCNKTSCTVCPFIEDGRNQYTFYSTGQTSQIKSHITCETANVIYMIQCTNCIIIFSTSERPNVVLKTVLMYIGDQL